MVFFMQLKLKNKQIFWSKDGVKFLVKETFKTKAQAKQAYLQFNQREYIK